MDLTKCNALKADLTAHPESPIVPVERFFDGNDDLGSIGCNLMPHPGMDVFRDVLTGLQRRPGVQAVFVLIFEINPGDECWPFTDSVFVVGTLSPEELRDIVSPLQPDAVGVCPPSMIPPPIKEKYDAPVWMAWWD